MPAMGDSSGLESMAEVWGWWLEQGKLIVLNCYDCVLMLFLGPLRLFSAVHGAGEIYSLPELESRSCISAPRRIRSRPSL